VRAALTEIVGDLGMSGCRPILRQQLGHASPEIRFWSCQSLGMLPDADDLPSLEVMLADLEYGYLDSTVADAARQAIEFIKSKEERTYRQNGKVLSPSQKEALDQIRGRHPHRTSACGALLSEIASADSDLEGPLRAALLYGYCSYKPGLKILDQVTREMSARVMAKFSSPGEFPWGKERSFFGALLYAISCIDNESSHSLLIEYLSCLQNPHLRADVVEAMSFEKRMFDVDLMMKHVVGQTEESILLSGLYAMKWHYFEFCELNSNLFPLLDHPLATVRSYTVEALANSQDNLEMIAKLSDDPDPEVRRAVADAVRLWSE
jgi:hypothetical protein